MPNCFCPTPRRHSMAGPARARRARCARLCPICSSSRSAAFSSVSIFACTCSSVSRASAFAASIICAASASALRRSVSRCAIALLRTSASRASRSASASRACLINSSVRSFKSLNLRSRSDSRFRNGRKNNRLNINQKTRNETISAKNVPQFGGICILRHLPCGDFRNSLHHRNPGSAGESAGTARKFRPASALRLRPAPRALPWGILSPCGPRACPPAASSSVPRTSRLPAPTVQAP